MTAVLVLSWSGCAEDVRRSDELAALEVVEARASAPPVNVEANAWAVSEGKRLYTWYNCGGCHGAGGGGGMGPALLDSAWLYGPSPEAVHETITRGRPNGMPPFAGRIPDAQIWQLTAYVRSMSGLVPGADRPGRADSMQLRTPEGRTTEPYVPWRVEEAK
jgi:cytochrome c oxidase cbb3-type subunit III